MEGQPQRRGYTDEVIDPNSASEPEQGQFYQPSTKKIKFENAPAEGDSHPELGDEEGLVAVPDMSSTKVLDNAEDSSKLEDEEDKSDTKPSAKVSSPPRPLMEKEISPHPSLFNTDIFPESSSTFCQMQSDMFRMDGEYRIPQSNTGDGTEGSEVETQDMTAAAAGDAEAKHTQIGSSPSDSQEGSKKIPSLLNINVFPPASNFCHLRSAIYHHPGDYRIPMQMPPVHQTNPVETNTQENVVGGDATSLLESSSSDVQEGSKKIPSLMDVYPVPCFRQQWPAYYQPGIYNRGMHMTSYMNNTWRGGGGGGGGGGGRTDTASSDIKTEQISTIKTEATTEAETHLPTTMGSEVDASIFIKSELQTEDPVK